MHITFLGSCCFHGFKYNSESSCGSLKNGMMTSDDDFMSFVDEDCNSNFEEHTQRGSPNYSPCKDCKSSQTRDSNKFSTSSSHCGNFQLSYYSDIKTNVSRRARSSSSSCSEQNNCETSQKYYYEDFETDSSEMCLSSSSSSCSSADEQLETKEKELPKRKKENRLQHKGGKQLPKEKKQQRTPFSRNSIINSQKNTKVNHRLLSARLLKIKELQNEMSVVKNRLEATNAESQILKQHHNRLLQAIRKYEKAETSLPDLMAKHYTEVKTLRALVRNSQEQERQTARRLRHVEASLLEEKDTLQVLQRLSQDKSLAKRGELAQKLTIHAERMDANNKKIQGLENRLRLNNTSFSHLLAAEKKKSFQAQLVTMNLEMEFKLLNQKIKEKERELSIRNIYSNRMIKDQQKRCDSESTPKVVNVSTSVQVDMIVEEMHLTEKSHLAEKSPVSKEDTNETIMSLDSLEESGHGRISSGVTDTSGMVSTHYEWRNKDALAEEKPPYDVMQKEMGLEEYHQTEKLPMEDDSNEIDTEPLEEKIRPRTEWLEELRAEELIQSIYDDQQKTNQQKIATEEQEDSKDEEIVIQRYETPSQLKKHYVFTNAIENLHQGYPSTGPLSNTNTTKGSRQINRQHSQIFQARKPIRAYEPSFGNINKMRQNDITPTCGEDKIPMVPTNKKMALLEELFGSSCILKDINSNFNLKEVDKEK